MGDAIRARSRKAAVAESSDKLQFRLFLELCSIFEAALPPGPSSERIHLRDFRAHIRLLLGETPSRASDVDVAQDLADLDGEPVE